MIEITNYEIRKTSDYDLFKTLDGNRELVDRRKDKIKKSISEIGFLLNPIIVNEKMEIIDGQGRFTALSELGLPIYYIVQNGVGIEECRHLNMYNEKWSTIDYIKSYAKSIEDYKRLYMLANDYPEFSFAELFSAIYSGIGYCNGGYSKVIQGGYFKASEEMFINARNCLDFSSKFVPFITFRKNNKHNTHLIKIIMFCFYADGVDNSVLYRQFNNYHGVKDLITNVGNQKDALICVENIYNYNSRKREDVHLQTLYKQVKKNEATQYSA